jgi:outer membrane protein, heavy metal efflux system
MTEEQLLPLQQKILDEMLLRYNGMLISTNELLDYYQKLRQKKLEAIEARFNYWIVQLLYQQSQWDIANMDLRESS